MRLNKYIAHASGISRRSADRAIQEGRVKLNGQSVDLGQDVSPNDKVELDGEPLKLPSEHTTIILNKPPGYICSRNKQGRSPTIYEILPAELHDLKPIGRLDKMSRGLLLLTTDGDLAQKLTHPKHAKRKIYLVVPHKELSSEDLERINAGVKLEDGISHLAIKPAGAMRYQIEMSEGRNRQIRRTLSSLGYEVVDLKRVEFGEHSLGELPEGEWSKL